MVPFQLLYTSGYIIDVVVNGYRFTEYNLQLHIMLLLLMLLLVRCLNVFFFT